MKLYQIIIDENCKKIIEVALSNLKKDVLHQAEHGLAHHMVVNHNIPLLERTKMLKEIEGIVTHLIEVVATAEEFCEVDKEHED